MKIGISATNNTLDADVDPRFGRCPYFLIIETDTMNVETLINEGTQASGGAGIQAAQQIANNGVEAVLTGNVGPNAFQTLSAAGIKVYTGLMGSVRDAVQQWKNGELQQTEAPSVGSHGGMDRREST